jgi:hypothetical protein
MLLAMILRLVNKINSGGDDDAVIACGFSLDLLSKLGEVSMIACKFIFYVIVFPSTALYK